jgi:hypothetical protein
MACGETTACTEVRSITHNNEDELGDTFLFLFLLNIGPHLHPFETSTHTTKGADATYGEGDRGTFGNVSFPVGFTLRVQVGSGIAVESGTKSA